MDTQISIVIGVVMNDLGEILMAKRIDEKVPEANNKWEFVGGKIEFGESPEGAVIREVKEESGLDVEILLLVPKVFQTLWTKADGSKLHTILICYLCQVVGGELKTVMDHKISELKFVKKEEIKNYETLQLVNKIIAAT